MNLTKSDAMVLNLVSLKLMYVHIGTHTYVCTRTYIYTCTYMYVALEYLISTHEFIKLKGNSSRIATKRK